MTGELRWPDASAYAMAARDPKMFFANEELQQSSLLSSPLGIPLPATGRNAAVFKATTPSDTVAARVFTRPPNNGAERYRKIKNHLRPLSGATFPSVEWLPDAVNVDSQAWPLIRMEWVEGATLDHWIAAALGDPDRLLAFATTWRNLFTYLDRSNVAHGDLQHGNVLVDADDHIHLVDLDGIWVPALKDTTAPEFGHAHFQHPGRIEARFWGRRMDSFAALVIEISLCALAVDPQLWDRYNDGGNNLIFLADDFEDLTRPIWQDLGQIAAVSAQVAKLRVACEASCERLVGPLEMLDASNTDPVLPGVPTWLVERLDQETPSSEETEEAVADSPQSSRAQWAVAAAAVALVLVAGAVLLMGVL